MSLTCVFFTSQLLVDSTPPYTHTHLTHTHTPHTHTPHTHTHHTHTSHTHTTHTHTLHTYTPHTHTRGVRVHTGTLKACVEQLTSICSELPKRETTIMMYVKEYNMSPSYHTNVINERMFVLHIRPLYTHLGTHCSLTKMCLCFSPCRRSWRWCSRETTTNSSTRY